MNGKPFLLRNQSRIRGARAHAQDGSGLGDTLSYEEITGKKMNDLPEEN